MEEFEEMTFGNEVHLSALGIAIFSTKKLVFVTFATC